MQSSEAKNIFVSFENVDVQMAFKSAEAGRPIHEPVEHIRIVIGGDKNTEVFRMATPADRERFHDVYSRFIRQDDMRAQRIGDGTALSAAPFITSTLVRDLEGMNVFTVEALAAMSDNGKQQLGIGANELVAKANAFLQVAKDSSFATKLAAEVATKDEQIADLKRQISELAARVDASTAGSASTQASAGRGSRAAA